MFYDENAVQFFDENNSDVEERFLLLGCSEQSRILIVCHCERDDDCIRIISARKATLKERLYYKGDAS